jgi:hypothetical protein
MLLRWVQTEKLTISNMQYVSAENPGTELYGVVIHNTTISKFKA